MPKHTAAKRAAKKRDGTNEGGIAPGSRPKAQNPSKKRKPRKK